MIKLKICLIGHYRNNPDEGVKSIAYNLYIELSVDNEVIKCNISDFIQLIPKIKKFNPDVIHFIVGPSTIISFVLSKIASILFSRSVVVMSAPQPTRFNFEQLVRFLKPDELFVQSYESEERFRELSCNTMFVPAGVDTERFSPVSLQKKIQLRHKYGFGKDDFIILHVGHITKGRNISALLTLGNLGRVLIVASTTTPADNETYRELKQSSVSIMTDYIPNIEEIYSIADCYVFPTKNGNNCIETPLSVLEAMSCNLPVIAMRFGAIPRMFRQECYGLYILNDERNIRQVVEIIKKSEDKAKTRNCILRYSWQNITGILKNEYLVLLKEKRGRLDEKNKGNLLYRP